MKMLMETNPIIAMSMINEVNADGYDSYAEGDELDDYAASSYDNANVYDEYPSGDENDGYSEDEDSDSD
jgi:hypothetical protein